MTRTCRTCSRLFRPVGKARYCSPSCRCGTDAGYNAGCRCTSCKAGHALNHKRLRIAPRPHVPILGTTRRIQGLARLGWSTAELSRLLGRDRSYLLKVTRHSTSIEQDTAAAVADLYERLCMTWSTAPTAARTATVAYRRGWAPPLGWDEGEIDDPHAIPRVRITGEDHVDEVVVQRVLGGDWHTPATKAERAEVVQRWSETGRPLAALATLTGWKVERYGRASDRRLVAS